ADAIPGWQNTKETPIRSPDLRVTVSRRLVCFPVSELRPPAGTIAAACPGGRTLGTKPAWSARPATRRALTRLPSLAGVPASTWNSSRKTNAVPPTLEQVWASWEPTRNRKRRRRGRSG
ncbi:mCG13968, partial [Mus musculus]